MVNKQCLKLQKKRGIKLNKRKSLSHTIRVIAIILLGFIFAAGLFSLNLFMIITSSISSILLFPVQTPEGKNKKMKVLTLALLLEFPPAGLILLWVKHKNTDVTVKTLLTVASGVYSVILVFVCLYMMVTSYFGNNKPDTVAVKEPVNTHSYTVEDYNREKEKQIKEEAKYKKLEGNKTTEQIETYEPEETITPETIETPVKQIIEESNILVDSLREMPLMNGFNTERIGTYAVCLSDKALLTSKNMLGLSNHVSGMNYNYVIIDFGNGTGLHGITDFTYIFYCKISKDSSGKYEAGENLTDTPIVVDTDTNKVNWGSFKK